jgi:pimeloyl-ACP methyl ester carboxylesterase
MRRSQAVRNGSKPSVLLVHGAFADGSMWAGVIAELQATGIGVIAVANPLRSLAADAAYMASVADGIDGPVMLAGHSYGGAVITVAGSSASNVVGLVYVAAFAPDVGESALGLTGRFPAASFSPPCARPHSRTSTAPRAWSCTSTAQPSRACSLLTCLAAGQQPQRPRSAPWWQPRLREIARSRLEDDARLVPDRDRRSGNPARGPAVHGQPGRSAHHRDPRFARHRADPSRPRSPPRSPGPHLPAGTCHPTSRHDHTGHVC